MSDDTPKSGFFNSQLSLHIVYNDACQRHSDSNRLHCKIQSIIQLTLNTNVQSTYECLETNKPVSNYISRAKSAKMNKHVVKQTPDLW